MLNEAAADLVAHVRSGDVPVFEVLFETRHDGMCDQAGDPHRAGNLTRHVNREE